MLIVLSAVKLICEIALLSLAGQWALGLMVGERRSGNLVYQILQRVSRPFVALVPWIAPNQVVPRHHPWVAFLLLALVWLAVTVAKISHCLEIGVSLCH